MRCAHCSLFHANGYGPEDFQEAAIGICTFNGNYTGPHPPARDRAGPPLGVAAAGGTPFEFPAIGVCDGIAMGHTKVI